MYIYRFTKWLHLFFDNLTHWYRFKFSRRLYVMNFKFQWWNFNLTKLIYIAPMQLPPFRRRRMKVQRKNVVISQLFKSLTLVFTCILKCTFSANFQSHLYRMCWFYLNIASFIFFFSSMIYSKNKIYFGRIR